MIAGEGHGRDGTVSTLGTLRRFVAASVAIAPRHTAEAAILTLVLSATEGVGLLLIVPLLHVVGMDIQEQGGFDRIVAMLAAGFERLGVQPSLGPVLGLYVAILGLQAAVQRRHTCVSALVEQEIVTAWRNRLYRAVAGTSWIHLSRTRMSDYVQMLTSEVERLGMAVFYLLDVLAIVTIASVYIAFAFGVSATLTALVLTCAGALALAMRHRVHVARAVGDAWSTASKDFYAGVSDHLSSVKIARAYGAGPRHADIFSRRLNRLSEIHVATVRAHATLRQQMALGSAAVLAAVVYVAYTLLALSTAQLLLLLFLFARLVPRMTGVYEKIQVLATALPAFETVTAAERRCLAAAEPLSARRQEIDLTDRIEFEGVTFDYGDSRRSPAVREVTLAIPARATTAIVGASGSGKSTLADLLIGLLAPSSGRVLVDGTPLGPDGLEAWRDGIGYVAQETFLFHDTVRANLLWAKPDADENEVWDALRLASATEFVAALPKGLDTVIGDRGVLISGGERQRLSLARALLRRPIVLVLDEATSSLDSENEIRIQRTIERLHRQMTIVIITHRLSTVRGADQIHVIDGGCVIESGSWDELVVRGFSRFRELCLMQGIDPQPSAAAAIPF